MTWQNDNNDESEENVDIRDNQVPDGGIPEFVFEEEFDTMLNDVFPSEDVLSKILLTDNSKEIQSSNKVNPINAKI